VSDGPTPRLVAAVAAGGALGALARWGLTAGFPAARHEFPWAVFAINVVGSFVLALLPAFAAVRRRQELAVALGPGVLGGFTTLSTYSEQTRALLGAGATGIALLYAAGTLAACWGAVALAGRWTSAMQRRRFREEGGDE
jgi:CrcB protein